MKKYFIALFLALIFICSIFRCIDIYIEGSFGFKFYQIVSNSMDGEIDEFDIPSLSKDDFVIVCKNINNNFYDNLAIGDVITYEYEIVTVSHRIIQIMIEDNQYIIKTQGDNSDTYEMLYSNEDIIHGKIIYNNSVIGKLINVLQDNIIVCIAILLPTILIMLIETKKLYILLRGDLKKRD